MGDSFFDTCIECIQQARQIPLHFLLLFAGSTLIGLFLLVCLIMSSTDGDENSDSLTSLQLHFSLVFLGPRPRPPLPSERKYRTLLEDGTVMQPQPLPCWLDKYPKNGPETQINGRPVRGKTTIESAELFMSVVVPAYNEEHRLVGMLEEAVNYLENEYGTIADPTLPTRA